MIYCPICGTSNRDGSRFCNDCGTKFDPKMQVPCPSCDALNFADSEFCHACGGSMLSPDDQGSDEAALPASLPAGESTGQSPESTDVSEIPAWLQDFVSPMVDEPILAQNAEAAWIAPSPDVYPDSLTEAGLLDTESGAQALIATDSEDAPTGSPGPIDGDVWSVVPTPKLSSADPDSETENDLQVAEAPPGAGATLTDDPLPAGQWGDEEEQVPALSTVSVEGTSLLSGVRGSLPVGAAIAQPSAVVASESFDNSKGARATGVQDSQTELFAQIVAPPPTVARRASTAHQSTWPVRVLRWFLYALLMAAVALPILADRPLTSLVPESLVPRAILPESRDVQATPAAMGLYDQIQALEAGAPVLVAFDYDPSTMGEMDVVAKTIIGHLMDRDARVMAVSLLPAGATTAQRVLDELATDHASYSGGYGQRYANLGYIPGQAAAVRLLGQSLDAARPSGFLGQPLAELPVAEGLDGAQDFALIVELAAAQDTLRWWIEQIGAPHNVPLGAGVSAAVDPMARTYYETAPQRLVGVVGGVPGATMYQGLRPEGSAPGLPSGTLVTRLDAQLAGFAVFVLAVLIGNAVYLVRRVAGKER